MHCAWQVGAMNVSNIPNFPPPSHPSWSLIMEMAVPNLQQCNCSLEQWHEYGICRSSLDLAPSAFSFGVRGHDPFGEHIQQKSSIVPQMYDCFHQEAPTNFKNVFSTVCIRATRSTDSEGRRFETLGQQLEGHANGSV